MSRNQQQTNGFELYAGPVLVEAVRVVLKNADKAVTQAVIAYELARDGISTDRGDIRRALGVLVEQGHARRQENDDKPDTWSYIPPPPECDLPEDRAYDEDTQLVPDAADRGDTADQPEQRVAHQAGTAGETSGGDHVGGPRRA